MTKAKTTFFCKSCGFESPKWIGKCPGCSEWNTFIEEIKPTKQTTAWKKSGRKIAEPKAMRAIEASESARLILPDDELNLVLGGGLVPGAVILLGGEPGIGKSTLLLQIALQTSAKTLYVSGEESETQIKLRAERLGLGDSDCEVLTETLLENIKNVLDNDTPEPVSYTHLRAHET